MWILDGTLRVPAARAPRWEDGKRTVAHPWRCITIPTLPWHRSSQRSARVSRWRREEVATADFVEEDEFVSMVEEAGVATGGVESAELSAGGLEAADQHRAFGRWIDGAPSNGKNKGRRPEICLTSITEHQN